MRIVPARAKGTALARALLSVPVLMALGGAGGCFTPESRRCDWGGLCPPDRVCDEIDATCIHPSQQLLCRGLPDGEPCHPPEVSGAFLCDEAVCRRSYCGDGLVDERPAMAERCDDGNTVAGDGCRADCRGVEVCGDGQLDQAAGEQCDDGNLVDHDNCTSLCQPPICGDGLVTGAEQCDDAAGNSDTRPDACRESCALPGCGDGVLDSADLRSCWSAQSVLPSVRQDTRVLPVDLDGDGLDDVVVLSADRVRLEIYLNGGPSSPGLPADPTHAHALSWPVEDMGIGDLGGDGVADLVLSGSGQQGRMPPHLPTLQWWENDGTGQLTPLPRGGPVLSALRNPTPGHFDGAPGLDVAAVHDKDCALVVVPGNGDGTFGVAYPPLPLRGGASCWSEALAAADLDGDGDLDLGMSTNGYGVWLAAGDGHGGLGAPPDNHFSAGLVVRDLALVDVDRDGRVDLVYPEQAPPDSPARVLLNQGDLRFAEGPGSPYPLAISSLRMDARDLDGDGQVELVFCDFLTPAVFLLRHTGGGVLQTVLPAGSLADPAHDIFFLETDGDGFLDLATVHPGLSTLRTHRIAP
jgi:cysteine-rich repeat protein